MEGIAALDGCAGVIGLNGLSNQGRIAKKGQCVQGGLRTGATCVEIANRLMKDKHHIMTPNEEADMKQCSVP
jgi:hypothetical protein